MTIYGFMATNVDHAGTCRNVCRDWSLFSLLASLRARKMKAQAVRWMQP